MHGARERGGADIVFETAGRRVVAGVRDCPRCQARTTGAFPDTMPGPLQYGLGIVACAVLSALLDGTGITVRRRRMRYPAAA